MFCIIDCSVNYLCFAFCLMNKQIMIRTVAPHKKGISIENRNYLNLKNSKKIYKDNILFSYNEN